jgi:hypothetical protein
MKKSILLLFLFATLVAQAQLSTRDIANGLKEALTKGVSKGADSLAKVDGYFKNPRIKIPFPRDAEKMEKRLREVGLNKEVDDFVKALNRGAEDAAKQVKPIFIDAIRKMTLTDATSILRGQPDAATQFLKKSTTAELKVKFTPVIKASLDKVEATKYYSNLAAEYDKIPFVKKVNPDLTAYTTDLAIQGLFVMIADEEKNIRANPAARTTDLLKKVFGLK